MQHQNWNWPFGATTDNPFFGNMSNAFQNPFGGSAWPGAGATSAQDPTGWMQQFFAQLRQAMPDAHTTGAADWQTSASALSDAMAAQWQRWSELFSHGGDATRGGSAWHSGVRHLLDEQVSPLGLSREKLRQMQELAEVHAQMGPAMARMQEALSGFPEQFQKALTRLADQRAQSGQPVGSLRGMIDLWIEAGEAAFSEIAHGEAFSRAFGGFTDAMSRARIARAKWLDSQLQALGLPTRAELQTSHARLQQARRDIRALKREVEALREMVQGRAAPAPRKAAPRKAARKASGKRASAARKRAASAKKEG